MEGKVQEKEINTLKAIYQILNDNHLSIEIFSAQRNYKKVAELSTKLLDDILALSTPHDPDLFKLQEKMDCKQFSVK